MSNRELKQPSGHSKNQAIDNPKNNLSAQLTDRAQVTRMGITGSRLEQLAAIIAERARLEQRAAVLVPEEATQLRIGGEAQQLEQHEAKLWRALCSEYADYISSPALPGMSRREATEIRLRSILVDVSSALFQEIRRELKPA